ncbi:MAG: hypothetical protein AUJ70_00100 [Candidatus Omnitrophica bacterium CG1_02_40_15]|nr:MAG: hypothetical protein AUJ70_00100 [Candidatus Omnitrophica bacterium CG1_02_40_15]
MHSALKAISGVIKFFIGESDFDFCSRSLDTMAYPLDLDFTLSREAAYYEPKDFNGVPINIYEGHRRQYNPTRIAAYALAHYNRYVLSNVELNHRIFLKTADWFLNFKDGLFLYKFDWAGLGNPWISCMAQGEGISVLVRAYHSTKDEKYLSQAIKAAAAFSSYVQDGGVRSKIDGKWDFLEEYPLENPDHTLNGFLYALIGILDLMKFYPQAEEEVKLKILIKTLECNWQRWDIAFWSVYNLKQKGIFKNAAPGIYHKIHISLIKYLSVRFKSQPLKNCYETWEKYSNSFVNRMRALFLCAVYRIL